MVLLVKAIQGEYPLFKMLGPEMFAISEIFFGFWNICTGPGSASTIQKSEI
jgi:hypothetical protein